MSGLSVVASRLRSMSKRMKLNHGRSFICGNSAVATRRWGAKIYSRHTAKKSNVILTQARNTCSSDSRHFGTELPVSLSSIKANVDANNVLRSPFPDFRDFAGTYVHEHIYGNLDKWHDKTALVCSATGRGYTYAQTRKICGRLATSLRRSNLRPGDTIAVVLPNVPEYGLLLLAASEAGIRMTPINPAYTVSEIRWQMKKCKASAIFTVPSKHSIVAASIADNTNVTLPIIVINDGNGCAPEGTIKFADLINNDIEEFDKTGEKTGVDPEDTFLLPYSSGTSGLPKGVELSHRNLIATMMQLGAKGVAIASETTASHQEILPVILPFYHIYGLAVLIGLYLSMGCKLVCVPQFTPENFFKVLNDNRSTLLYLAPPLIHLLANDERLRRRHVETIKTVASSAAPIGEEVLAKFISRTPPGLQLVQGYGLTECPPVSMAAVSPHTSVGLVVPNAKIRIVGYEAENEGNNLGVDEVGEIYVRGPQVMKGYNENPEATANCMEGEWFKTGDLGCYDKSGFIYIRGRLKEMIKVQGFQVAPAEIEDLIQGYSKVADAAVIGVPHEKYGEIPKAFVVPKKGVGLDVNEIKEYVAERVAKYKRLGHVEFVDKIPKSAAGKILRKELEKM